MDVSVKLLNDLRYSPMEIEKLFETSLGGVATITGGGAGQNDSQIDVSFEGYMTADIALDAIRSVLTMCRVPSATITIEGRDFPFVSQS